MKIIFVVNNPDFLISHRLEVCKAVKSSAYEVHIICPEKESVSKLVELGFTVHFVEFGRNRSNPVSEILTVFKLISLFKMLSPDLVHLITIKPYLYGGIAARIAGVKSVVSAVAGLGILFSSNQLKFRLLRLVLYPLFKFAFGHSNQSVIFQNIDDRNSLVNLGVVDKKKVRMIRGSGVDLTTCPVLPEPNGSAIVSFAARLLKDKGVEVFVEASRLLKQHGSNVRFWLIGQPDEGNANSVTLEQLKQWESEELVELFGFRADIPGLFSKSNIVALPSFYGEGLPKVLIEAGACGRAVITTDHPGCRDAIVPNETGMLVPVKDPVALAGAIQKLVEDVELRRAMGRKGRALAEDAFAIEKIVEQHMQIYMELMPE